MAIGKPFPDLTAPAGWTGFSMPPQLRLIPPGTTAETARAVIIVSPIAPRTPAMPPPAELIAMAITVEQRVRLDLESTGPPETPPSDHGLGGVALRISGHDRELDSHPKRIYVIYFDEQFLYGINFMAFGADYDAHVETFWQAARSIRPFAGALVPPAPLPPLD